MDIYKMREMKNAIRRIESTSKVTGTAQYLDDLEMQGMAYGGIIRSPYPHAKVLSIDFSEAKRCLVFWARSRRTMFRRSTST